MNLQKLRKDYRLSNQNLLNKVNIFKLIAVMNGNIICHRKIFQHINSCGILGQIYIKDRIMSKC